jgi:hypothetical protein
MTAWAKLLAASQLLAGTAWQLISSPKVGGAGLIVNDGVTAEIGDEPVAVEVAGATMVEVNLDSQDVAAQIGTIEIEVEIAT